MQTGVAKGLKVPCLFMITEVSIRCQKNPEVGIRRIPAYTTQYTTDCRSGHLCSFYIVFAALGALFTVNITVCCKQLFSIHSVSVSCVVHCISTDTASVQLLPVNQLSAGPQGCSQLTWAPRQSGSQLFWQKQGSHGSCKVLKNPENEKKEFQASRSLEIGCWSWKNPDFWSVWSWTINLVSTLVALHLLVSHTNL